MKNYIVVWLFKGSCGEYVNIIDNVKTPQDAVNEVRRIHPFANVVAVGSIEKGWE